MSFVIGQNDYVGKNETKMGSGSCLVKTTELDDG